MVLKVSEEGEILPKGRVLGDASGYLPGHLGNGPKLVYTHTYIQGHGPGRRKSRRLGTRRSEIENMDG